jgi:hypothetical protein
MDWDPGRLGIVRLIFRVLRACAPPGHFRHGAPLRRVPAAICMHFYVVMGVTAYQRHPPLLASTLFFISGRNLGNRVP